MTGKCQHQLEVSLLGATLSDEHWVLGWNSCHVELGTKIWGHSKRDLSPACCIMAMAVHTPWKETVAPISACLEWPRSNHLCQQPCEPWGLTAVCPHALVMVSFSFDDFPSVGRELSHTLSAPVPQGRWIPWSAYLVLLWRTIEYSSIGSLKYHPVPLLFHGQGCQYQIRLSRAPSLLLQAERWCTEVHMLLGGEVPTSFCPNGTFSGRKPEGRWGWKLKA